MAHLTLAGLSEDGKRLLLVDDHGTEHTLEADAKLRKVLRGEHERLGQLEIHMESALRPRDIQARIRAGETPEAVAQAAQTTVDQIMAFANPVLAERAHLADRATRASLRRPTGAEGARTLGDAVSLHLQGLNVPEDAVEWDAWRREDGRWNLTATFATPKRKGTATFSFDAPGNYVVAEDEAARWLVGEAQDKPRGSGQREPRQRRLSSVATEELPLGDDAIEMISEPEPTPTEVGKGGSEGDTVDLTETAARIRSEEPTPESSEQTSPLGEDSPFLASAFQRQNVPGEPLVDGASPVDSEPVHEAGESPAEESGATDAGEHSTEAEQPRRPVNKKRGRASVPSWDEIMFGGSDQES